MEMKMVTEMSTQLKWKSKLKHLPLPKKAMKILLQKKIVKTIRQRRRVLLLLQLLINPNRNTTGIEDLPPTHPSS